MAIKIKRSTINNIKRWGPFVVVGVVGLVLLGIWISNRPVDEERRERKQRNKTEQVSVIEEEPPAPPKLMYGIEYEQYRIESGRVQKGQTLSHILGKLGVSVAMIDKIDRTSRPVFNMRSMRARQPWTAFICPETDSLRHFIYEKDQTDFVVVSIFGDDSVSVYQDSKEIVLKQRKETAVIKSSLWNALKDNDLPAALSVELEDIFGWSVDFFGLQVGDKITVIFEEKYIDTVRVGIGSVLGAQFDHLGKSYYAIPFQQGNKVEYWDENGNSLRKQLLKAPLKYTRVSSKFSNSRMHPVLKVRRPHHGVDYAAPAGTPVVAIADGVVTFKGWDKGGGGNTLKIKHANNLSSGYLHLQGFAKGVNVGSRVSQGQLIGYVGTTGRSTGPHLDFRLYKGGTPIDPLKAPSNPVEPITEENIPLFNEIRDKVMAELAEEDETLSSDLPTIQ